MGRLACLNLPALPLQVLLRQHPEWKGQPTVVVAEDKTQGLILYVNRAAAQAGVRPGWKYGAGLSLVRELRAGVVADEAVASGTAQLVERLQRLTPQVEPAAHEPGVFWLGVEGLLRVYPALNVWAEEIVAAIQEAGFTGSIVVGFTRFGTYAVSRTRRGITVFADPQAERAAARQVPLPRLGLPPVARLDLEQLGIRTVEAFAALPDAGILERFGPDIHRLHRQARGLLGTATRASADGLTGAIGFELALNPSPLAEPAVQTILLEYPEGNLASLLFLIKSRMHGLLSLLASRRQALAALEVRLRLEGNGQREAQVHRTRVQPAAPTLDAVLILDLVRLRLEGVSLVQGVAAIVLTAQGGPAPMEQLRLFSEHPRRDLRAGDQALARIRAEFGDAAVARAVLKPGHLPEAQFAWMPVERMAFPNTPSPSPASGRGESSVQVPVRSEVMGERALVRRLYTKAAALPSPERNIRDGTFVDGQVRGTILRRLGPYPVSGAWWAREVRRDYYFLETAQGELLWLYYDRRRRQWFLQGRAE